MKFWRYIAHTPLVTIVPPGIMLLSSNIGLFSRYASDKYLLLESWEEEWIPLWVCLPYLLCEMNNVLPYNDPWTCSCIKLMLYQASWSKRYVNNEIKNHEKNINQVHPVQNLFSSCTTPMYINHVHQHHAMCQKISSMECINHMPLSICQPCVISLMICLHHEPSTITMYQTNTNFCTNQVIPMVYYHAVTIDHQWCTTWSIFQPHVPMCSPSICCMNQAFQQVRFQYIIKIYHITKML